MQVVEVDGVDAETSQRGVDRRPHILRRTVDFAVGITGFGIEHNAELGREHHVVSAVGQNCREKFFVGSRTVYVCGVEQVDPDVESVMQRRPRFVLVGLAVRETHSHTTQSER